MLSYVYIILAMVVVGSTLVGFDSNTQVEKKKQSDSPETVDSLTVTGYSGIAILCAGVSLFAFNSFISKSSEKFEEISVYVGFMLLMVSYVSCIAVSSISVQKHRLDDNDVTNKKNNAIAGVSIGTVGLCSFLVALVLSRYGTYHTATIFSGIAVLSGIVSLVFATIVGLQLQK